MNPALMLCRDFVLGRLLDARAFDCASRLLALSADELVILARMEAAEPPATPAAVVFERLRGRHCTSSTDVRYGVHFGENEAVPAALATPNRDLEPDPDTTGVKPLMAEVTHVPQAVP